MTRVTWDKPGERRFEAGVDRGVLYPRSSVGVPWNGLVSVQEDVSGGEQESYYYDGVKYLDFIASEDFQGVLEAYTWPDEFDECSGNVHLAPGLMATRQRRKVFDLVYRTKIGNDVDGIRHGHKLNLVYNAVAQPAAKSHQSASDNVEPSNFQWTITAVPPAGDGYKPTAHFVIDSTDVEPEILSVLEQKLYGNDGYEPFIPTQEEVIELLSSTLVDIVDGGSADWSSDGLIDGGSLVWAADGDSVDGGTPASSGLGELDGGTPSDSGDGTIEGSVMIWTPIGGMLDGGAF